MELVNKICIDLTIIFLLVYCIYNIMRRKSALKKLQTFKTHNNTLQKLLDDVQCFKHDSDNIITTIGGYVNSNDIEGLKEYYYQLEGAWKIKYKNFFGILFRLKYFKNEYILFYSNLRNFNR